MKHIYCDAVITKYILQELASYPLSFRFLAFCLSLSRDGSSMQLLIRLSDLDMLTGLSSETHPTERLVVGAAITGMLQEDTYAQLALIQI